MNKIITGWMFKNESIAEKELPIESISDAIELIVDASRKEIGETLSFYHLNRGLIGLTVGKGYATLAFNPNYDSNNHSTLAFKSAVPITPAACDEFLFVDNTNTISSIDVDQIIPVLDAVRGVVFILENHDFPSFLNWRSGL